MEKGTDHLRIVSIANRVQGHRDLVTILSSPETTACHGDQPWDEAGITELRDAVE
jgi:hypothetical protein